jgi:YggT family protein
MRFLIKLTDPVLEPFRKLIPPLGMIDISPIVVLILLNFLQMAVAGVLLR